MKTWTTALPDWESRIVAGRSLIPFAPLFPAEAKAGLKVFKSLRIVDAPGSPTFGEACRPWIFDFAGALFGAYEWKTGRRHVVEFLLSVSKKNFKSGLAAGLMLTALIRNWRSSAEYLVVAPTMEVANNSFRPARDAIRANEKLSALFHVQDNLRRITHRVGGALLQIVAADNETVSGKKATGVLVDELWLFGRQPRAENMLREATGGLAARPEGFVVYLTTQSDDPPAGIFAQKLLYARGVRDGRIVDPKFCPVLYEFPAAMLARGAHRKPENFYVTNPNLGASVDAEFLAHEMKKADEAGEASVRGFMAKHLNVEIGLALLSNRWAGADFWEAAALERGLSFDDVLERSEVVDLGIDGGGLDDLLGFCALGRERGTHKWLAWFHAWAHPSVLAKHKSQAARLEDFAEDGDLTVVDELGDDVDEVAELVAMAHASGKLDKIGVDPHGLGGILDAIADAKVPAAKVVGISQGWKLTGAIKTAERRIAERGLVHNGCRLMAWAVGNARVIPQGNAVGITKQASGAAKIDPLMALFNATQLMSLNPASTDRKFQMMFFGNEARTTQ